MAKTGATKAVIAAAAKNSGVAFDVECFLGRLDTVLPHSAGGVYATLVPDFLHSFALGWVPKTNNFVDAIFKQNMRPTPNVRNIADARDRVDARLSRMPPFVGLLRFQSGWWEAENMGATSGAENMSLLSQLAFVFVGDDILIPSRSFRIRVLALHWSVTMLGRELRTAQFYRAQDIESLKQRLNRMAQEFHWIMDVLGPTNTPGVGMNIPKFHDLMSAAYHIVRFGCLMNGDTGSMERMMKHIKRHDERVGRSRANDGSVTVFTVASAAEFDGVLEATEDYDEDDSDCVSKVTRTFLGAHVDPRTSFQYSSGSAIFMLECTMWTTMQLNLRSGMNGPAVEPRVALEFERLCSEHHYVTCGLQIRYTLFDEYTGNYSVNLLKPGHCVQLCRLDKEQKRIDNEYAQILAVNVADADRTTPLLGPLLAVSLFRYHGLHSELPVPSLSRDETIFIHLNQVRRRAHVVPIYKGGENESPCEPFPDSFLVNTSVFPHYVAPVTTTFFMSCSSCKKGRLQKPLVFGDLATCPLCSVSCQWL